MLDPAFDPRQCRQDTLQRLQRWLDLLEQRVEALLQEEMKPAECEMAYDRHITLMMRLLKMRQEYSAVQHTFATQAYIHSIIEEPAADDEAGGQDELATHTTEQP